MGPPEGAPKCGPWLVVDTLEGGKLLHLALNRPDQLNSMTDDLEHDLCKMLDWFEATPSLWVCLVSGRSEPSQRVKAFCAGQDLRDWLQRTKTKPADTLADRLFRNVHGFGSLSRRRSRKPIIAAVDGVCLGGGLEMIVNCDLVVATSRSTFGFPEVQHGIVAAQGAIPRIALIAGHALASELLLLGRPVSASEARDRFRFVNRGESPQHLVVVENEKEMMEVALSLARTIISNSPAAVQVTKLSLLEASHHLAQPTSSSSSTDDEPDHRLSKADLSRVQRFGGGVERATVAAALLPESTSLYGADTDFAEGLRAFSEKRRPKWKDPPPPGPSASGGGKAKL